MTDTNDDDFITGRNGLPFKDWEVNDEPLPAKVYIPTPKSQAIDDMLTAMNGISRAEALKQHLCVSCRATVGDFTNQLSEREYTISGMCQACQDAMFGE